MYKNTPELKVSTIEVVGQFKKLLISIIKKQNGLI